MRFAKICLSILALFYVCAMTQRVSAQTPPKTKRIVIAASTVLDGQGRVLSYKVWVQKE